MTVSQTISWNVTPDEIYQGQVERITVYHLSKVLEIHDSSTNLVFYLIYYKNILLGGGKVKQLKEETFLHEAYEQGIPILPSHPLYSMLLPQNRNISLPNKNHLFTQLQDQLSLLEIALVGTFMDSFIEKQQLAGIIREIFNHFRRNGQFRNAYLTAKLLNEFLPELKTTKELVRSSEFEKYRNLDNINATALIEQDPLFMEIFYFKNRNSHENEMKLHKILQQQNRSLEQLVLFIDTFKNKHDVYDYHEFKRVSQQESKVADYYALLKFIWESSPDNPHITEDLLKEQLRLQLYPDALTLITGHIHHLSASHYEQVETILESIDPASLFKETKLNQLICRMYPQNPEKNEGILRRIIICLLKNYDPTQVQKWIKPIKDIAPDLPVYADLDQLEVLSNDLDQLTRLGELYYSFELLDRSIECFTWEMELQPDSIEPVRWLSKLYQEKGMHEEAENYKNLSKYIAKRLPG